MIIADISNKAITVWKEIFFRSVEINSIGVDFINWLNRLGWILLVEFVFDDIE